MIIIKIIFLYFIEIAHTDGRHGWRGGGGGKEGWEGGM